MGKLHILPHLDSEEMATMRYQELNISRELAATLGRSAVQAGREGFYVTRSGQRVVWHDAVKAARARKQSIAPDSPLPSYERMSFARTRVQVSNETTLGASRRLVDGGLRPLALNFANGISPGGGFLDGARAQEETLCRSSALYLTLIDDPMYEAHRKRPQPDSTDWAICSPDVPVFRLDDGRELQEPWFLSFITCAAPYAPHIGQPQSGDLLRQRIHRVLAIAQSYGYTALVLGAWGCGAFANDPRRTAMDFRQALEDDFDRAFSDVVFAITDWSPERRYLGPFRDVFANDAKSIDDPRDDGHRRRYHQDAHPNAGERGPQVQGALQISMPDRFRGCLLGLAVGDAVGTTLEFRQPGTFEALTDMAGGGPFGLAPGQWTDDTSMALCLATSLVERGQFDARDQMDRYCRWAEEGYLSSTGRCFDIGNTVTAALQRFRRDGNPYAGSTDPHTAGNGSIMRLAPVVLRFFPDLDAVERFAADSSRMTHGAQECIDACRLFARVIYRALLGQAKEDVLLGDAGSPFASERIVAIAHGSYRAKPQSSIRGSGYVVESLEAALWAFAATDTFEAAILKAANLGDDADTTAAVCGQVAGAFYGQGGIPGSWLERLTMRTEIAALADQLGDWRSGAD